MKANKVAYVVIGWNNADILEECILSIKEQTYKDKKIIFLDNDSKDNSTLFIKENFPEVEILEPGWNTAFALGNNIAIEHALKDQDIIGVVLLNSDARLEKNWTASILKASSMKPLGALFQGTTLDYYNHHVIDSTHIYVSQSGQATQGNWRYIYNGEFGPKKVFGTNAAACYITRSFIEAQPFGYELLDARMFMYLEDVDLAARAMMMGWESFLVPHALAYHMGSASSGKNPGFSLYMTFRNNSAMLYKNFPIGILLKLIPRIIGSDIETFRHLRRMGKKSSARKVLKGRMVGLFLVPLYTSKRMKLRKLRKISNKQLWKMMEKGF